VEMKVLFNKFHRGINLMALLFSNLYSEFRHLKISRVFSYKDWSLKVPYSLQYVESIHAPDLRIRFFTCHIWNMREVLVSCREKLKKIITDFHVLGLFIAKKHDLGEKNFSVCHAPLPLNAKFVPRLQPPP
jgi:hypothetical protein